MEHRGSTCDKDFFCLPVSRWLLLLSLSACLVGCTSAPHIQENVNASIRQALTNGWSRPVSGTGFSFADACAQRARLEPEVSRKIIEENGMAIEIEQAASWVWPRLMIDMGGQLPMGKNADADVITRGGLSLRYDFQRALFRDDAVAAAKAGQLRSLEQTRLAVSALTYDLFSDISEIDFFQQEVALQAKRLESARAGLSVVDYLERWGEPEVETRAEWVEKVNTIEWELERAKQDLALAKRRMCYSLGMVGDTSITVTNAAAILALADGGGGNAQPARALNEVWERHPAARVAELDLFLAEMSVLDAKRERIPRVNGSLGVGHLSTWREDGETASLIFGLEILAPLIDFGDIRRSVERAQKRREMAMEEARGLVRRLASDLAEMRVRQQESMSALTRIRAEHQAIKNETANIRRLTRFGALSPLASIRHSIVQLDAEVRERRAMLSWRKAWAAYKRCLGDDLCAGFADQVLHEIRSGQQKGAS